MVTRFGAIAFILIVCALAGTGALSVIVERLGAPLPVRAYDTPLLAAIVLEPDGRIIVHMPSWLMHFERADVASFLYLHELGHARLGHLLPVGLPSTQFFFTELQQRLNWSLEYDADRWATRASLRAGLDPVAGLSTIFAVWGEEHREAAASHPGDVLRLDRVKAIVQKFPR